MTTVNVPKLVQTRHGVKDGRRRRVTGVFGVGPQDYVNNRLVIPNQQQGGAFCARTRIWFPSGRLKETGRGLVGDSFYAREREG